MNRKLQRTTEFGNRSREAITGIIQPKTLDGFNPLTMSLSVKIPLDISKWRL
jgi:hypothetical protein